MRSRTNIIEPVIHILAWVYIFLTPLFFSPQNQPIDWRHIVSREFFSVALLITFYLNYFCLIPLYFLHRHYKSFCFLNIILIVALSGTYELMHTFQVFGRVAPSSFLTMNETGHDIQEAHLHTPGFQLYFFSRNMVNLTFALGCSIAVRLSERWQEAETARSKAELGRTEAELQSLKNQISPHFLLNTLNNIYALTAFAPQKAQAAILELSKMLRYLLYEELGAGVDVRREVNFLQNYVALMQLRLTEKANVTTHFQITTKEEVEVAPHIFISLVENAFKHGMSSTERCFVRITLFCDGKTLTFDCKNSCFNAQNSTKKTPGIGLQQVARRLELNYSGKYVWQHGWEKEGREYHSRITIALKPG